MLFIGVAFTVIGLCIDIAWFIYFSSNPGMSHSLTFYIINLFPGLLLLTTVVLIPNLSTTRRNKLIGFGIAGFLILSSLTLAIMMNIFSIAITLAVVTETPSSKNTPQEMFRYTIQDPISSSIKNIEGVGDTWQGYSIYLRFQASKPDVDSILGSAYKPVNCSTISSRFELPKGYDRFKPPWNPKITNSTQCYEANGIQNSWTGSGSHYLMFDRKRGIIYFRGIGA